MLRRELSLGGTSLVLWAMARMPPAGTGLKWIEEPRAIGLVLIVFSRVQGLAGPHILKDVSAHSHPCGCRAQTIPPCGLHSPAGRRPDKSGLYL